MTDQLWRLMHEWEASGTEQQRRHAAHRLTHPDALAYAAARGAPPADYPPIHVQAGSALAAAASFVASGLALADDAERSRRLAICRACEHFDAAAVRCRRCGCFAALKARIAAQSCPDGRW